MSACLASVFLVFALCPVCVFSVVFRLAKTISSLVAASSCSALGYRVSFLELPFPHNLSLFSHTSLLLLLLHRLLLFCSVFFLSLFLFLFAWLGIVFGIF
jgi:hypothetical protein